MLYKFKINFIDITYILKYIFTFRFKITFYFF